MTQLSQQVAEQVERNFPPMLNNFKKITSWLKQGTNSEYKLPNVVLEFLTKVDGIAQNAEQSAAKVDTLAQIIEEQTAVIAQLSESKAKLEAQILESRKQIDDRITKIEMVLAGAALVSEVEAQAEPTPEAKPEPAVELPRGEDRVQVTAEAVNAGDISPEGLAQIDSLIDGLLPSSDTPVADIDEL